jgi:Fur family transcriptional regulator, ferric uptake regulator
MAQSEIEHLLKEHHLRNTPCRNEVLKIFLRNQHALAHANIEKKISDKFDRVTIYRTLTSFLENGIIHKVLDNEGGIKYALCNHEHETGLHNENHIHFKCRHCGLTECLDHFPIPDFSLPKGYKMEEINLLVEGICKKCVA